MTRLPLKTVPLLWLMLVFCSPVFSQTDPSAKSVPCQEKPCAASREAAVDQDPAIVRFEGLHAFTETDVLKFFREKKVPITKDRLSDRGELENAISALKELFSSLGYDQVIIDAQTDDRLRSVTFVVEEGPRSQIAEIVFEGNRILSSQDLATMMREYLNKCDSSKNGYDAEILDYSIYRLTNFARSKGYLQAQFGEPIRKFSERGLIITIKVDEGVLYRIGSMNVECATVFSAEQVKAMIGMRSGDIADGEALSKLLYEDLKKAYAEKGYITYTAEVTPEFKQDAKGGGVVNFKITIDEGLPFMIRKIEFKGEDNLSPDDLRNLMLIGEGRIFNQSLFEESIKKLNETGLFQPIDKERDVDFISNEEKGLMDLVVKLTKKR